MVDLCWTIYLGAFRKERINSLKHYVIIWQKSKLPKADLLIMTFVFAVCQLLNSIYSYCKYADQWCSNVLLYTKYCYLYQESQEMKQVSHHSKVAPSRSKQRNCNQFSPLSDEVISINLVQFLLHCTSIVISLFILRFINHTGNSQKYPPNKLQDLFQEIFIVQSFHNTHDMSHVCITIN